MQELELFDPKVDFAFKHLFGSDDEIFISFANSILNYPEGKKIKSVTFLNNDLDKDCENDKASRLDVLAELEDGRRINIEMQSQSQGEYKKRSLYYWAKLYEEQIKEGENYISLKPAIGIHVLNFNLLQNKLNYHTVLEVVDAQTFEKFTDDFEIHYLELPKVPKKLYSTQDKWMQFLKNPCAKEVVAMEDPAIQKAYEKLKYLSQDSKARMRYEARRKFEMDYSTNMELAQREGRDKERLEIAKKMLAQGLSLEFIQDMTGLSADEIKV